MAGIASEPPDVATVTMIHKVKSKMGYTEMHTAAPGYGENELVASSPSQKNWKGISIAILVIKFILGSVGLSVYYLTPPDTAPGVEGDRFSIKHILDAKFKPRRFNGSWISENELVFRDETDGLSIFKLHSETNYTITQIVTNTTFRRFDVAKYSLSPDRKYLLLAYKVQKRYRFSYFAHFTIYEISSGLTWNVESSNYVSSSSSSPSHPSLSSSSAFLSYARWLPGKELGIIFVENFNVYYVPDVTEPEKRVFPISRQDTVRPEVIIHGIPDWIYEEDILKRDNAIWISPNGKKVVFATFNDSDVQEVIFEKFGGGAAYPATQSLRYPKAGTPNPTVSLWIVDLSDLKNLEYEELKPPLETFNERDYYFTAVSWIGIDEAVAVNWMNRAQNFSFASECRPPTWFCKETFREEVSKNSWSTLYSAPIYGRFLQNKDSFLIRAPLRDGTSGFYTHIALVKHSNRSISGVSSSTHPITLGKYEVRNILAWDERNELIYFTGVPGGRPSQLHLYQVSSNWKTGPHTPICLTCTLPPDRVKRKCTFVSAHISPSFQFFVLECLGPGIPGVYLFSLSTSGPATFLRNLDENSDLLHLSESMAWPRIVTQTLPVRSSGENDIFLRMKIYYPPDIRANFVDTLEETFPVVLHVYSGPGTQLVTDEWKVDYNTFMSSSLRYIVVEVDGAGSGGQGEALEMSVKGQLGKKEVQDQIAALKYFINSSSLVDKSRVAVSGVSYGGYVSAMLLTMRQTDFLICGVSVSPVVDWRYYESSYSERYMGFPTTTDNIQGYEDANLIKRVPDIIGKNIFLAHGFADRNVHFQNSMILAKTLVNNGVNFEQQIYPDEGHFLEGVKYHLYRAVESFLGKCFYKPPVIED